MILTVQFVIAAASGAMLIGFSGAFEPLMVAGIALIAASVATAAYDWLRLSRVNLEVNRDCDDKLSLGAPNAVKVRVRNLSHFAIRGVARDEHPIGTKAQGNVFTIHAGPRSEIESTYHITPPRRGDASFGDIYVRLFGPLRMAVRQIRFPAPRHVKVYPNLLDIRRYDIGLKQQRSLQPGLRTVRMRGRGTDFESLRESVPDDELRAIDWKATARRGKMITRQYQEEKAQNVMLLLDCGRIMGGVIDNLTRLDHSINAAVLLAHVAARKGDRVGMMAFGEEIVSFQAPRAGHGQVLNLLSTSYNLADAAGDTDYYRALAFFARKWTRRSLVVMFTEVSDVESSRPLLTQIWRLTRKHLVMCVMMSDPAVVDAARRRPETADDAYLRASAQQVLQAREAAAAEIARAGAIVLDKLPEQFTPAVVDRYLDIKAAGRL